MYLDDFKIFNLRVSWSSQCGDVSLYNMKIRSDCAYFHGHQCKDTSVRTPQCVSSEILSVHSNVTSYQHPAMPGTKYV